MTDPFKNQRYSLQNQQNRSADFAIGVQQQQQQQQQQQTQHAYLNRHSSSSQQVIRSEQQQRDNVLSIQDAVERGGSPANNQHDEWTRGYLLVNKEHIAQLKNNIELIMRGASLFGPVAFYPLRALRWQCQINAESSRYHLTPFTLVNVFYNLNYHGYYALWKGCFSMVILRAAKTVLESIISEVFLWEKNIEDVNRKNKLPGHASLKFLSACITAPLFSVVIYQSVQSNISNDPSILDLFRETWNRITGYRYNYRTRFIPLWSLLVPISLYSVAYHFCSNGVASACKSVYSRVQQFLTAGSSRHLASSMSSAGLDQVESEVLEAPYVSAMSTLLGELGAMMALYPIETVINRLIVQGTRTIIDNTDSGLGVVPINTRYDGFYDCCLMINETEGVLGFYKGFGSLLVETALRVALLRLAALVTTHIFDTEWTSRADRDLMRHLTSSAAATSSSSFPQASLPSQHQQLPQHHAAKLF